MGLALKRRLVMTEKPIDNMVNLLVGHDRINPIQQIFEEGEDLCPHEVDTLANFTKKECPICWQALKEQYLGGE